jgi:hypothetical protein
VIPPTVHLDPDLGSVIGVVASFSKFGHHFSNKVTSKLMLSKNVRNKKGAPKFLSFNAKKIKKD